MSELVGVVRDFFGLDLPARSLPLQFNLPVFSGEFQPPDPDSDAFNEDLAEYEGQPEQYFKVIQMAIKHLNHCEMNPRQRRELNEALLTVFYPKALAQLAKHAQTGGVPEPVERRRVLRAMDDIAQTLIVSYQILFAGHYHGGNYHYVHNHAHVLQAVVCILELYLLKQQAKALRYQELLPADWAVINTLFYVMYHYDDVDDLLPTLAKALEIGREQHDLSLLDRFVLLHGIARFEMLRWPTHIQWVIGSYIRSVTEPVLIRPDEGEALGRHDWLVYCYDQRAAHAQRLTTPPGGALVLDARHLMEAVRKDCMALLHARSREEIEQIPRFARLPEREHFVIFDQLVRGLSHQADHPHGQRPEAIEDLRIFVGFAEVFKLLAHRQSIFAAEERLEDLLSRRSAKLAEDHLATDTTVWTVVSQTENTVRLSTQETAFTTAMRIGSLLACGIGDNINRPVLAVVTRIHRWRDKEVEVDLQRMASYAEPVMFSMNQPLDKTVPGDLRKSALLVYDHKYPGQWSLIFPPRDVVLAVDKLALHRGGQATPIPLTGMRIATNDFYCFATGLTSAQLAVPGEPDYPTPPCKQARAAGWLQGGWLNT